MRSRNRARRWSILMGKSPEGGGRSVPILISTAPVNVNVPSAVVLVADRVKRLVVVAGFVPKVALTPLGKPEAAKFTLLLNPFRGLIVIVVEPPAF